MPEPSSAVLEPQSAQQAPAPFRNPARAGRRVSNQGLRFRRLLTAPGVDPFDAVPWEAREVRIAAPDDGAAEPRSVEVPAFWSETAAWIAAAQYMRRPPGGPRERSVRQMIRRVAGTIARWGREDGCFFSDRDAAIFEAELAHILLHQIACFNSPVWYNVGIEPRPQCAASFILPVEDSLESILELARTEGMLFKYGSGTGTNLSPLRSSRERLDGGGRASGPVAFMRGLDALAGTLRTGGKTRRAAKMAILDADHPDILDFVRCKEIEERKAWSLIDCGLDGGFDATAGAYGTVAFQNANHSVRAPDELLEAVQAGRDWTLKAVTDGRPLATLPARDLMHRIAEAAWLCGDPGLQYDTTINAWNPCPSAGRIRASNSCSEYLFLDGTACVLASLNLMRFHHPESGFDTATCRHVCAVMTAALDLLVDRAGYPGPRIEERTRAFRPLGLGYSNLGALLMANGLPYGSEEGRHLAAAVTALISGAAWAESTKIAAARGSFSGFGPDRVSTLGVLHRHRQALAGIDPALVPPGLLGQAAQAWEEAARRAERHGLRNAQISAVAPTGTISFLMDCDTTGAEPDLALVKSKRLSGGGAVRLVNRTVAAALERLGYGEDRLRAIVRHVEATGTIEGSPHLEERHLPVFDCAFPPARGSRSIEPEAHLRMMAAIQPFVSGAISKTINLPASATPEDVERIYLEAWSLKLKAVAVYRDGCKRSQPLAAGG